MPDRLDGLDAGREVLRRFLVGEDDSATMLSAIARLATEMVPGCDLASISFMCDRSPGTLMFTHDTARMLAQIQYDLDDGPCLAAMRHGGAERVDVASETRWPEFIAAAQRHGVVGVLCSALRSDMAWGGLNLYSTTSGGFNDEAMEASRLFAERLGVAAVNAAAYAEDFRLTNDLRRAAESGAVVEQAERVLMAHSDGGAGYEAGRSLDTVRRDLMLTNEDLWVAYFGLGGTARPDRLVAYLEGSATLSRTEHNVVVHALNEGFVDLGEEPRVPYIEPAS